MPPAVQSEAMPKNAPAKESISLTLNADRLAIVKDRAAREEISVSQYIDRLIRKDVESGDVKPRPK